MTAQQQTAEHDDDWAWQSWLRMLLTLLTALCAGLYIAVVLIDPFSTGRFALTQRIDRASTDTWYWFTKAGIIRDQRFDAAIIGSSVSGTLDPVQIGQATGRAIVQLTLYGAGPPDSLLALRSFVRHHPGRPLLNILVLDLHWCRETLAAAPEFPSWVYESSDREYLSQIFSPFAINTSIRRVKIWLGFDDQRIPADGFAPIFPPNLDAVAAAKRVLSTTPETDAPSPTAPFPNLDDLAAYLASTDDGSPLLLVFVPVFVNALPPPGSAAAARDAACKAKVSNIAKTRRNAGVLDLQGDSPMARKFGDYIDALHFRGEVAQMVGAEIAKAADELQSRAH